MKRHIVTFLIIALIKSGLLFLIILLGEWIPSAFGILRFIVFFIFIWLIDLIVLKKKLIEFINPNWIKYTLYLFGTYSMVIFITGPMFLLYNLILNIQPDSETKTPTVAIIGFLIIGLIISTINSVLILNREKNN
ncbi:hypothetical protein P700755_001437 [Psychroflexus torquis ATCC 700755]|uniref:Transmembrane protein n=1 Tax=Psychroflexus torquis (strain ATCC 700755 / CIP 106069 / ACAM 623) TaxID=313595 RepID=K4IGZ7_PSYTT|nr:hypothetical protein [Psychroflexus torquis]AFU68346.1 hypothetical protein P700755_001437 [Psychroflexus torquis ATCC 700755]